MDDKKQEHANPLRIDWLTCFQHHVIVVFRVLILLSLTHNKKQNDFRS